MKYEYCISLVLTTPRLNICLLGVAIAGLVIATIGIAMNFLVKKSDTFMSAIQDVFILLFVLDCDEKVFGILKLWNIEIADGFLHKAEMSEAEMDTGVEETEPNATEGNEGEG
jgi:hypothetical protein